MPATKNAITRATASGEIIAPDPAPVPRYLHSLLAQCGLPYRPLPSGQRTFKRENGNVRLFIEAGTIDAARGQPDTPLPVPSGSKPRLLLIHACTRLVQEKEPTIELGGSLRAFLRTIGINTGGGGAEMAAFRHQANALATCHMRLTFTDTGDREPMRVIDRFNPGTSGKWDGTLRLAPEFCADIANHAVPLDLAAVAALQSSPVAMDVYAWMAQRLHRITSAHGDGIAWAALRTQFGDDKMPMFKFRQHFKGILERVHGQYQDARFAVSDTGIRLFQSHPPVAKRDKPGFKLIGTVPATNVDDFELDEPTRAELREIAPGWCGDELARRWKAYRKGKERPDNLPKAFLGWAKKFTKGKTPDLFAQTTNSLKAAPAPASEATAPPGKPLASIAGLDFKMLAKRRKHAMQAFDVPTEGEMRALAERFIAAGGLVLDGQKPETAIAYWRG
jgi:hypothetical protein